MFGQCTKTVKQKPLKDANFLFVYVYVHKCVFHVFIRWWRQMCQNQAEFHMGCCRPKINDAAVVY